MKNAILKRVLAPGSKVDVLELVEQFNVSRTPIKEALNRLHHEGLIVIKPRKGTFVAEFNRQEIIEILDARLLFETWAAKEGIQNITDEDLKGMEALCLSMDRYYQTQPFDFLSFNELDIQFHQTIVRLGANKRILAMYRGLNAHWLTARGLYETAHERALESYNRHQEILDAYKQKDLTLLLDRLTKHITVGKEVLLQMFQ